MQTPKEIPILDVLAEKKKTFLRLMTTGNPVFSNSTDFVKNLENCWKQREKDEVRAIENERELHRLIASQRRKQVAFLKELSQAQAGGNSTTYLDATADLDGEIKELVELAVDEKIRKLIQEGVLLLTVRGKKQLGRKADHIESVYTEDVVPSLPPRILDTETGVQASLDEHLQREINRLTDKLHEQVTLTHQENHQRERLLAEIAQVHAREEELIHIQQRTRLECQEQQERISELVAQVHTLNSSESALAKKVSLLKLQVANGKSLKPWVDILSPEADAEREEELRVRGRTASRSESPDTKLRVAHLTPEIFPIKAYRPAMSTPAKTRVKSVQAEKRNGDETLFSRYVQSATAEVRRILIEDESVLSDECDPYSLKSVLVGRPMR